MIDKKIDERGRIWLTIINQRLRTAGFTFALPTGVYAGSIPQGTRIKIEYERFI